MSATEAAVTCPTCRWPPSPAPATGSAGSTCRTGTPSPGSVRKQFADDQVTRSRKLEGAWWADGGAYFVASFARNSDGSVNEHDGQVWFYDPATETVTLKTHLRRQPRPRRGRRELRRPGQHHRVAVRRGDPCRGRRGRPAPVGVTEDGQVLPLARNDFERDSEFCGPPSARTALAVRQHPVRASARDHRSVGAAERGSLTHPDLPPSTVRTEGGTAAQTARATNRPPDSGGPRRGERVTHPRKALKVTVTAATVATIALATGPAVAGTALVRPPRRLPTSCRWPPASTSPRC